ncbi:MAG: hypothetical protein ACP5N9_00355 [Candidatus Bilamarchaeum sp.]
MPFKKQSTKIFLIGLFFLIFGLALTLAVSFFRNIVASGANGISLDKEGLAITASNASSLLLLIGVLVMATGLYYKLK